MQRKWLSCVLPLLVSAAESSSDVLDHSQPSQFSSSPTPAIVSPISANGTKVNNTTASIVDQGTSPLNQSYYYNNVSSVPSTAATSSGDNVVLPTDYMRSPEGDDEDVDNTDEQEESGGKNTCDCRYTVVVVDTNTKGADNGKDKKKPIYSTVTVIPPGHDPSTKAGSNTTPTSADMTEVSPADDDDVTRTLSAATQSVLSDTTTDFGETSSMASLKPYVTNSAESDMYEDEDFDTEEDDDENSTSESNTVTPTSDITTDPNSVPAATTDSSSELTTTTTIYSTFYVTLNRTRTSTSTPKVDDGNFIAMGNYSRGGNSTLMETKMVASTHTSRNHDVWSTSGVSLSSQAPATTPLSNANDTSSVLATTLPSSENMAAEDDFSTSTTIETSTPDVSSTSSNVGSYVTDSVSESLSSVVSTGHLTSSSVPFSSTKPLEVKPSSSDYPSRQKSSSVLAQTSPSSSHKYKYSSASPSTSATMSIDVDKGKDNNNDNDQEEENSSESDKGKDNNSQKGDSSEINKSNDHKEDSSETNKGSDQKEDSSETNNDNKGSSSEGNKATDSNDNRISAVKRGVTMDGIVYSPYNNDHTCKNAGTVRNDLQLIASKNIRSIRVYASDCNSLVTVLPVAKELGLKVDQGIWIGSTLNQVDSAVNDVINAGKKYGWDLFTMFIVGNEVVLSNQVSAGELAAKIKQVRNKFRAAGFQGPITTAEPPSSYLQHSELCDAIDIVGINAHPFFDPSSSADTAGSFLQSQISVAKQACPNKEVYIAETGYPSQGSSLGSNVPSVENQRTAINNIMTSLDGKATFLSTYDDYWKDPGPYGIEQHFGIIGML